MISDSISGIITTLFGLIAGYWLTKLTAARSERQKLKARLRCIEEAFSMVADERIVEWHSGTITEVRNACIEGMDNVPLSTRKDFCIAWRSYCTLTANAKCSDSDNFIGPTFNTTHEGLESGSFLKPDFTMARTRVIDSLRRIVSNM